MSASFSFFASIWFHSMLVANGQGSNFECGDAGACTDSSLQCDPSMDCNVNCTAKDSCRRVTLQCPADAHCHVHCNMDNACKYMNVNATASTSFTLHCPDPALNGNSECALQTLYCPINGHLGNASCIINNSSSQNMNVAIQIYAVEGFNDLLINGLSIHQADVYCGEDYSISCRVVTEPPPLICDACMGIQSPSQFPTASPSETPTSIPTAVPSVSPSRNPTMLPSTQPTLSPSIDPTSSPSDEPSVSPTTVTLDPTVSPSQSPTLFPSEPPSNPPSEQPTVNPTGSPTPSPILIVGQDTTTTTQSVEGQVVTDNDNDQGEDTDTESNGDENQDGLENGESSTASNVFGDTQNIVILILSILVLCLLCVVFGIMCKRKRSQNLHRQKTAGANPETNLAELVPPKRGEHQERMESRSVSGDDDMSDVLMGPSTADGADEDDNDDSLAGNNVTPNVVMSVPVPKPENAETDTGSAMVKKAESDRDLPDLPAVEHEADGSDSDDSHQEEIIRGNATANVPLADIVVGKGPLNEHGYLQEDDDDNDDDDDDDDDEEEEEQEVVVIANDNVVTSGATPNPPESSVSSSSSDNDVAVTPMGLAND